jgi:hypothetical protein
MFDAATITAIAAAIAVVITSITSLIVALRGVGKKVEKVETIVNGHTTALITEIQTLKQQLGIQDDSVPAQSMSDALIQEDKPRRGPFKPRP